MSWEAAEPYDYMVSGDRLRSATAQLQWPELDVVGRAGRLRSDKPGMNLSVGPVGQYPADGHEP